MKRNLITLSDGSVIDAYQITSVGTVFYGGNNHYFCVNIRGHRIDLFFDIEKPLNTDAINKSKAEADIERDRILDEWFKRDSELAGTV